MTTQTRTNPTRADFLRYLSLAAAATHLPLRGADASPRQPVAPASPVPAGPAVPSSPAPDNSSGDLDSRCHAQLAKNMLEVCLDGAPHPREIKEGRFIRSGVD